jgi:hypothetical protein
VNVDKPPAMPIHIVKIRSKKDRAKEKVWSTINVNNSTCLFANYQAICAAIANVAAELTMPVLA